MTYEDLYRANEWVHLTQKSIDSGKIQKPDFLHLNIWIRLGFRYLDVTAVLRVSLFKQRSAFDDPWVMFYLCSNLRATDPRDHIYGLLGLGDFGITPDYWKDLSSVLQDLVRASMRESKKLDYLLHAGVGISDRGSFESLPSWAPNFSFNSQREGMGLARFESGHADRDVFNAATKAPTLIDSVLRVSGLLGPAVVKVYEAFPLKAWNGGRMYEFAQDYVRRATSQARGVHPLKAIFDVIRDTVIQVADPIESGDPMVRLAIAALRAFLAPAKILSIHESLAHLGVPFDDNFTNTFFNIFFPSQSFDEKEFRAKFSSSEYCAKEMEIMTLIHQSTQVYFRFTEIEGGYLGLAPRFSRPGDVVAILKGCKVPLILRKHEDHYIIIRTSNILGLMEGEAKELCESGRARFEDIQIR